MSEGLNRLKFYNRDCGASFGGEAAADASIDAELGEIDRPVLLAAWTGRAPEKMKGRKLFIVARDDAMDDGPGLPKIRANYEKAEGPKELIILNGSAHAQFIFATVQGIDCCARFCGSYYSPKPSN